MLKVWRAFFAHRRYDERGSAEFATALMVLPVLFILIVGSVEMGFYVQTRMRVENIARDAARQVAAQGGNDNERTNSTDLAIDVLADRKLWNGKCKLSQCDARPTINCKKVTKINGTPYPGSGEANKVEYAGETVTCVVQYHYKKLSGGLLDNPVMGLGIGGIMKKNFTVSESARSETGWKG